MRHSELMSLVSAKEPSACKVYALIITEVLYPKSKRYSFHGGSMAPYPGDSGGGSMPDTNRSELEQEIVEALVESKAINFEAMAGVLAKYGARAALTGTNLGMIIGRRVISGCIPPDVFNPGAITFGPGAESVEQR